MDFTKIELGEDGKTLYIEVDLDSLSPYVTCPLCKGLLREAFKVTECLHTFCKCCLEYHMNYIKNSCPQCHIHVSMKSVQPDYILQSLISKLFADEELQYKLAEERDSNNKVVNEPYLHPEKRLKLSSDLVAEPAAAPNDVNKPSNVNKPSDVHKPNDAIPSGPKPKIVIAFSLPQAEIKRNVTLRKIEVSATIQVKKIQDHIAGKIQEYIPGKVKKTVQFYCENKLLDPEAACFEVRDTIWKKPDCMVWDVVVEL